MTVEAIKRPKKSGRGTVVDITDPSWSRSGITIEYVKSSRTFYISGWYDTVAGIEGIAIDRDDFLALFDLEARPSSGTRTVKDG